MSQDQLQEQLRRVNQIAGERQAERAETERQLDVLNQVMEDLHAQIMELMPLCEPRGWEWRLEGAVPAVLRVEQLQMVTDSKVLADLGVVAYTSIRIECRGQGYWDWSHSLWFYRSMGWMERGFSQRHGDVRFALTPYRFHGVDRWAYIWKDRPVEPREFIERWIKWFASAALGDLRPTW